MCVNELTRRVILNNCAAHDVSQLQRQRDNIYIGSATMDGVILHVAFYDSERNRKISCDAQSILPHFRPEIS